MMRKFLSLSTVAAFLIVAGSASANVTEVKAGGNSVCIDASWVIYNNSETDDTVVEFDIGPWGYGWGKIMTRSIAPGGYQAGSIARKTTFKNNGPGTVSVNCQRQRADRHNWKIDPGSSKTYQPDYFSDHVTPGTYIEPGMGLPVGTERGLFAIGGTGDGGATGEVRR